MDSLKPPARELCPKGWLATYVVRRNGFVLRFVLPYLDKGWVRRWMKLAPIPLAIGGALLAWRFLVDFFPFWWGAFSGHARTPFDEGRFFLIWLLGMVFFALPGMATTLLYVTHVLSNPGLDARSQARWVLGVTYGFPVGMPLYWKSQIAAAEQ